MMRAITKILLCLSFFTLISPVMAEEGPEDVVPLTCEQEANALGITDSEDFAQYVEDCNAAKMMEGDEDLSGQETYEKDPV